jgi:hypothetical protein
VGDRIARPEATMSTKAEREVREYNEMMGGDHWQPVIQLRHGNFFGPMYESRKEAQYDVEAARKLGLIAFIVRIPAKVAEACE